MPLVLQIESECSADPGELQSSDAQLDVNNAETANAPEILPSGDHECVHAFESKLLNRVLRVIVQ
jgi:hypothetical protein